MKWKNFAIAANLMVFSFALSAQANKPKAPVKRVAAKIDAKAAAKKAEEEKMKMEAEAKAKAEAAKTAESGASWYNFGGNLVQGFTYNPSNPSDGYNGTVTWTDRANEYQLNQAWTYFEVPTDTSKKDFDIGGRVDLEFGSNYRWSTSAGLEDKIFKTNTGANNNCTANGTATNNSNCNTTSSEYGLALTQAYLDFAYKSVKLRVGHIVSPVGYFTVDTSQNFFQVLPYTYQYGEPFTHWGAWLYWTVNNKLTLSGGATHGGDNFNGAGVGAKLPGFLGTLSYVFDDKSTIDWVVHISKEYNLKNATNSAGATQDVVNGSYNGDTGLYSWRYFQTLVYKRELTSNLEWVAQTDFGIQKVADIQASVNATNAGTAQTGAETTAMWYGFNTYFYYKIVDALKFGVDLEWFRDTAGVRVGSALPTASFNGSRTAGVGTGASPSRSNYIGNFFQITFGPKWQVQKNMFLRLMGRYDYFDGTAVNAVAGSSADGAAALPFANGNKRDQFIVGLDMAFVF